jgi:hypothetical protein
MRYFVIASLNAEEPWTGHWPREALKQFRDEYTGLGNQFFFEKGSAREHAFLALVGQQGVSHYLDEVVGVTHKDIPRFPLYYLCVKRDRDYRKATCFDWSSVCGSEDPFLCLTGVRQVEKVSLDYKRSLTYDIMSILGFAGPEVVVVSQRLARLMREWRVTGCELVPCLEANRAYSDQERVLGSRPALLDQQARYFQLVPTARIPKAPRVGNVVFGRSCSRCGAVFSWGAEHGPSVFCSELCAADVQFYDECESSNHGRFRRHRPEVLISARLLQLCLDNKVRGLARYLAKPPVAYAPLRLLDDGDDLPPSGRRAQ